MLSEPCWALVEHPRALFAVDSVEHREPGRNQARSIGSVDEEEWGCQSLDLDWQASSHPWLSRGSEQVKEPLSIEEARALWWFEEA